MENKVIESINLTPADIQTIKDYEEAKAKYNNLIARNDEAILNFMRNRVENGESDTFEQDEVKIKYTKPHKRKVVDTNLMKEDGVYECYTKETDVKDSIKISIKYED